MSRILDADTRFYPGCLLSSFAGRKEYPLWEAEKRSLYLSADCLLAGGARLDRLTQTAEARLAQMDAAGIETAVISMEQGLHMGNASDADDLIAQTHQVNQAVADLIAAYPERFLGLAAIQAADIPAAVQELEDCALQPGFVGCQIFSDYRAMNPENESFWPIFQAAEALKLPVYLHPAIPPMPRITSLGSQMYAVGAGNDVSITAARLIAKGLFDRYPQLQMVLGNLGEMLVPMAGRMDHYAAWLGETAPAVNQQGFRYYLANNFYYLTSGLCSSEMLECVRNVVGQDRILYSSGYPDASMERSASFIRRQEGADVLSCGNASALFNLDL